MANTYFEKLKDPRWQKKRLEVLDAGGWKCARCADADSTLHVHHRQYFKGREPWEYGVGQLEVLCESCHKDEHEAGEDPLLLVTSFVPSTGPCNREAIANLIAGFCGQFTSWGAVSDPDAYLAGCVAQEIGKHAYVQSLMELEVALSKRDRWTVRAAINDFILDLNTRPDAVPPVEKKPL